jgi:heme exporter protein D
MGGVMAGVRVPWPAMGSSPERKGKVERGARLGAQNGEGEWAPWGGAARSSLAPAAVRVLRSVHEKKLNVRKKRRRKERRKRKRKEKNRENMDFWGEK